MAMSRVRCGNFALPTVDAHRIDSIFSASDQGTVRVSACWARRGIVGVCCLCIIHLQRPNSKDFVGSSHVSRCSVGKEPSSGVGGYIGLIFFLGDFNAGMFVFPGREQGSVGQGGQGPPAPTVGHGAVQVPKHVGWLRWKKDMNSEKGAMTKESIAKSE